MSENQPVDVIEWEVKEADDGTCIAIVTYEITDEGAEGPKLRVSMEVGDDSAEEVVDLDGEPGVPTETRVPFELPFDGFQSRGELTVEVV